MKTYPTSVVKASIKAFTHNSLEQAQASFLARPTADAWNETVQAMLVHQQAQYLKDADYEALRSTMIVDLGEAIVKAVTGRSIEATLALTNAA